jgi:UDP-glucose 4-epimerase
MVLPRFIEAAKAGKPLQVYGDGNQARCFCHVSDAVEALMRLQENPNALSMVFNVGSREETSIIDLAKLVIGITGSTSKVNLLPYKAAFGASFEDMERRRPSVRRLIERTGFAPKQSLSEIIRSLCGE